MLLLIMIIILINGILDIQESLSPSWTNTRPDQTRKEGRQAGDVGGVWQRGLCIYLGRLLCDEINFNKQTNNHNNHCWLVVVAGLLGCRSVGRSVMGFNKVIAV